MAEPRRRRFAEPAAIFHLLDCLNPGGTETQLLGQLAHLDRRRYRPLVGVFHRGGVLVPRLEEIDVPVAGFPLHTSLAHPNSLVQIARLVAYCRRERVQVIHAHDFYANLVGVPVARLSGARLIASRRDLAHWLSRGKRRALGMACRAADVVIANSRAIAELRDDGLGIAKGRLRLVENGLDLDRFDAAAHCAPSPPLSFLDDERERERTVAVVSNLHLPSKGHADLLRAMALLDGRGVRMRLVVIGDGAERANLVSLARALGVDDRVFFVGRRLDVPCLLSRVGVACLPSWAEGFPNAVMEAMAARLPVVATRVGGCVDLVEDGVTGLLVEPRRPAELAFALERVLADPISAAAMGQRAREVIGSRYSLRRAAATLESIYDELCLARSPHAALQQSGVEADRGGILLSTEKLR